MADTSVFINGAADGALSAAFGSLPGWATQQTLLDIEGQLKESLKIQTKTLTQILKSSVASPGSDESLDLAEKKAKADKDELARGKKKTAQDLMLNKTLTALVAAGYKVLSAQEAYVTVSNDLFKSGINLLAGNDSTTSSMESLNQMVLLTGLRLETLQKVVEKYSGSVNAIGITKFTQTLSKSNKSLTALGYSSEQQAELLGSMLESESSYSDVRHRTTAQLSSDLTIFGGRINTISQLTGQSAKQLQENIVALSKNSDSMDIEAEYGKDAADRINALALALPGASEMIQQFASTTSLGNEQMFQTLVKSGAGPEAQQFADTIQKVLHGSLSLDTAIKQFTGTAKNINSAQIAGLKTQQLGGNESAKSTRDFINALRGQGNTISEATKPQIDAATKSEASIAAFSSAIESAKATVEKAFPALETQLDLLTGKLTWFNDLMNNVIGSFSATTRSWIAVGVEAVAGIAAVTLGLRTMGAVLGAAGATGSGGVLGALGSLTGMASKLATGLGVAGSAAFAAYEVFRVIQASQALKEAQDHEAQGESTAAGLKAMQSKLTPAQQQALDAMGGDFKKRPSAPTTPMPSTINSPSAISTNPITPPTDSTGPQASNAVVGSGIEKPPTTSDINSLMTYQNSLSAQMLISMDKLVAVNNDILKYSRMQS